MIIKSGERVQLSGIPLHNIRKNEVVKIVVMGNILIVYKRLVRVYYLFTPYSWVIVLRWLW